MQQIKKLLSIITLLIFVSRLFVPFVAYADDATPTPTPTATSTPTPSNSPTPTPTQSNNSPTATPTPTGTTTPTPTPTETTTPTPTPSTSPTATPSGTPTPTLTPLASGSATPTPSNMPDPSASPSPAPGASTTTTGNATAVTQASNDVNTTSINSQAVNQTINIFLPKDGNVNLSDPSKIAANVVSNNTQNGQIFNISIVNNNAYVNTDVISIANTGDNTASGAGEFAINTGNATSLVQLVNKINVTLVNSEIHFITINIYGTLNGNIILPTPTTQASQNCTSCGSQTNTNTQATVTNTVGSGANSGTNNVTTGAGNAAITTGNATSAVNIIDFINELIFGVSFNYLIINDLGTWNGNFLGWGDLPATTGNTSLSLSPTIPTNNGNNASSNISSNANVTNNISSLANTGNNTITTSSGNGMIITGNAQSIVSLINLVNSVFINTKGFFAFINIFGTLNGDIGDASKFITPTPAPNNESSNTPSHKEDGGQLILTNSNNTGPYVLPGDTVTFFLTVHNPGTGKVYGAHLRLSLVKDGVEGGAADYNLGDLDANKSIRVTTGLVLSHYVPAGTYIAHAVVTGTTGDTNTSLQASADSTFQVFVPAIGNTTVVDHPHPKLPAKTVLAAHTPNADTNATNWLMVALITVLLGYLTIRVIKDRHHLIYAFTQKKSFKERLNSLRLFLL